MSIDRVFTMKGHGTVITGTLLEGNITEGDYLFVYPSDKKVRVKGVQVYGKASISSEPGQRVALNLNIDHTEIHRGDVLSSYEDWAPTQVIDALINVDALNLKHWQRVRVYHGTKEVLARIAIESSGTLETGEESIVQLRLETPLYCKVNDPIILRQFSPVNTIGGGRIVNPYGQKHKWSNFEEALNQDMVIEQALFQMLEIKRNPFLYNDRLFDALPFEIAESHRVFKSLVDSGTILELNTGCFATHRWWQQLELLSLELILNFHVQNPLKIGIEKETLRSSLNSKLGDSLNKMEFQWIIDQLILSNRIAERGKYIFDPHYTVVYSKAEQDVLNTIKKLTLDNGFKPTEFSLLYEDKKLKKLNEEMVYHLINNEILVKINEEAFIHIEYYEKNKEALVQYLKTHGEISVAQYRDLLDISRKASLQLLEHFDRIHLTKRLENTRVLINQ